MSSATSNNFSFGVSETEYGHLMVDKHHDDSFTLAIDRNDETYPPMEFDQGGVWTIRQTLVEILDVMDRTSSESGGWVTLSAFTDGYFYGRVDVRAFESVGTTGVDEDRVFDLTLTSGDSEARMIWLNRNDVETLIFALGRALGMDEPAARPAPAGLYVVDSTDGGAE